MKKTIAIITSCAALLSFSGGILPDIAEYTVSHAETLTYEDWEYEVIDGTVKLTMFNGDPDYTDDFRIYLPAEINGMKVTSIAEDAFSKERQSWCHLVVPEDSECIFPTFLFAGANIGEINYGDFSFYTDFIESLTFSEWKKRSASGSEMTDLTIPESVCGYKVIGFNGTSLAGAKNIRKLTLPDTMMTLPQGFISNTSVTEVNIPKSVLFIPDQCFSNANDLKKVIFHDDIVVVSNKAFLHCPYELPEEYIDENAEAKDGYAKKTVGDWILSFTGNSKDTLNICLDRYVGSDSVLTIPTEVGDYKINKTTRNDILYENTTVKEVQFAKGAEFCPNMSSPYLEKVTLPNTIENINSFDDCTALKSITIPSSVKKISGFNRCTSLKSITIPLSVKTINGFSGCTSLEEAVILGDEIEINGSLFADSPLKTLELPGNCTMSRCKLPENLETLRFRAGDRVYIGTGVFQNSSIKELVFDDDINEIDIAGSSFRNSSVEKLVLPPAKISIEAHAFRGCSDLKEVTIDGDADIESNAFAECSSLEKVTLNGKCNVAELSFYDCPELAEADFDLDSGISGRCFNSCPKLFTINGIEVITENGTDFAPELKDYVMTNCQTAHQLGFIDRFTVNSAKKIVSEVTDGSMSEIEKAKALHDWVCNNTVYDNNDVDNLANHVDSTVFLDGVAVCAGYAMAYNLLLHEAGIDSCCVGNGDHAWNVVKIDGKWFHIDTTWDDGDTINYNWFLKTDSDFVKAGGAHEKWDIEVPSYLHSFQPADLPACVTPMQHILSEGGFTADDAKEIRADIIKADKYALEYDYNLDGKLNAADIAAAYSKAAGKTFLIGDVNGDGQVDAIDASDILAEYANLSVGKAATFSDDTAVKADMTPDGNIDASDASAVLGFYSYVSTGGEADIAKYLS